jgi:hypothetical protein
MPATGGHSSSEFRIQSPQNSELVISNPLLIQPNLWNF